MENRFERSSCYNKEDRGASSSIHRINKKPLGRKAIVHFNSFRIDEQKRSSKVLAIPSEATSIRRPQSKKGAAWEEPGDEHELCQILEKMKVLRLPVTIRKNYAGNMRVIADLLNAPIMSKSTIMRELKCLMSHSSIHDSYLVGRQLARKIKESLKECSGDEKFRFKYDELGQFIKKLEERKCD